MARRVGLVAVVSIALLFPLVACEAFHEIHVGATGSFYDPATILANQNDVVTFIFDGPFHDVTQSTFAKPCQPLAGGFSSGIAGKGNNNTAPSPSWSLRITNASVPIWFYCGATIPLPHCTTGMVGAINPPSIDAYNQFLVAAKNVSLNVPVQAPSIILSGQGAFATTTPQVTSGTPVSSAALTSASTPTSSSTSSTVAATETAEPAASTSSAISTGSIVGAAVGGGVGFIIICFLAILVYRALRKDRHAAALSPYTDPGTRRGDDANNRSMSQLKINRSPSDPILSRSGQLSPLPSTTASPPPTMAYTPPSTSHGLLGPSTPDPPRRVRPLPPSPQPNNTTFSHSEQPSSPGVHGPQSVTSDQQSGGHPVNINELAREVATLLHTQTSKSNLGSGFSQLDEEDRRGRHSAEFSVVSSPPHYYQD
ncbi:hypothetical protein EYR40_010092 [Pleurotus pulmonarius]|nr:hypothetical protein EYR36_010515 [Pleurotus pulmonarius]KAF4588540.1 hypothetical protein EYR40_010092 [Pleurotus pulmonarius]